MARWPVVLARASGVSPVAGPPAARPLTRRLHPCHLRARPGGKHGSSWTMPTGSRRFKRGAAAELVTLAMAARDQRPPELPRGSANVEIAQGKGNPERNRRATATGQRPKGTAGERRPKGNRRKAGEGEEPSGQTGKPGGKPTGTGGREVRPQTTRVTARGFGAARVYASSRGAKVQGR